MIYALMRHFMTISYKNIFAYLENLDMFILNLITKSLMTKIQFELSIIFCS
jgi:hypothetical protein